MLRDKIAARFFNNPTLQEDEQMRTMMREIIQADGQQKENISMFKMVTNTLNSYVSGFHLLQGKPYLPNQLELKQESLQQQRLKLQITDGFLEGKNDNLKEFTHLYLQQELQESHRGVFASMCEFWSNRVMELFALAGTTQPVRTANDETTSEPEEVF